MKRTEGAQAIELNIEIKRSLRPLLQCFHRATEIDAANFTAYSIIMFI